MKTDLVVAGFIVHNNKILLIHHAKLDMWLPVGGHIDENETPDDALLREIKEEVNLDCEILNQNDFSVVGKVTKNLATPILVNVHNVGDHNHCCFVYTCKPLNLDKFKINKELKDYGWFSKEDLMQNHVPEDIREIGLRVLDMSKPL